MIAAQAPVQVAGSRRSFVPVLLYHSVSDNPSPGIEPYTVSPGAFERQLDLVARHGTPLTISRLARCMATDGEWPADPIAVTFDDGFADNLVAAAPMLAARGLTATVYVTTGFLGRAEMLDRRQLRDLDALGIEVGAHAHSHTPLDELSRAQADDEIRHSKAVLEDALGHSVPSFAYPHGYSDRRVREDVRSAGFASACGVRNALSHPGDDRWNIARLTVLATTRLDEIERWLGGEGAPVAPAGEAIRTTAWRAVRRGRRRIW